MKELVEFIHESPTNFHAVANAKKNYLVMVISNFSPVKHGK